MSTQSTMHTEWTLLQKIQRTAASMKQALGRPTTSLLPSTASSLQNLPLLSLPFPDDILQPIHTLEMPPRARELIIRHLTVQVSRLQEIYSTNLRKTCVAISSMSLPDKEQYLNRVRDAYQALYWRQGLPPIKFKVSLVLTEVEKRLALRRQPERRRAFNTEYTPLLERYFEQNAYPSAADRLLLARKSMMSPRQIEVWFQNHRNRAKKEGKALKRSSPYASVKTMSRCLEECTSPFLDDVDTDDDCEEPTNDSNGSYPSVFSLDKTPEIRQPHVFPSPFSAGGEHNPFPIVDGKFRFPPPPWIRKPASHPARRSPLDMDEFIRLFSSKLHFRERLSKKCSRQSPDNVHQRHLPWFSATLTIPPTAPHPSLVRTAKRMFNSFPISLSRHSTSPSIGHQPCPSAFLPSWRDKPRRTGLSRRRPTVPAYPTSCVSLTSDSSVSSKVSGSSSRSSSLSSSSSGGPATPLTSPNIQTHDLFFTEDDYHVLDQLFSSSTDQSLEDISYHSLTLPDDENFSKHHPAIIPPMFPLQALAYDFSSIPTLS